MPKRAHSIIKTGKPFPLTEEQYTAMLGDDEGICRACGHEQGECEPDAHDYKCDACGMLEVASVEELLTQDEIVFI